MQYDRKCKHLEGEANFESFFNKYVNNKEGERNEAFTDQKKVT